MAIFGWAKKCCLSVFTQTRCEFTFLKNKISTLKSEGAKKRIIDRLIPQVKRGENINKREGKICLS
jgi:hypothetical protein